MFESHKKSLIQHCERSELRLHFEWTKVIENAKNSQFWQVFNKPDTFGQIVLPDMSILIGQKLMKNAKFEKFKCDI